MSGRGRGRTWPYYWRSAFAVTLLFAVVYPLGLIAWCWDEARDWAGRWLVRVLGELAEMDARDADDTSNTQPFPRDNV